MQHARRFRARARLGTPLALSFFLLACGGGGGGSEDANALIAVTEVALTPSCTECSAVSATTYSGSGVGIWHRENTSGSEESAAISIDGLSGQDVTLIFTNHTNSSQTMTSLQLSTSVGAAMTMTADPFAESDEKARIQEFNRTGWAEKLQEDGDKLFASNDGSTAPVMSSVGTTRTFYHYDDTNRSATLRSQTTAADGVVVNIWVEDGEYDGTKISADQVAELAAAFSGAGLIYDSTKDVGGPVWGPHSYPSSLISGSNQPIEIVLLNFDKNGRAWGTIGYFWSLHNFLKSVDPNSNEALALFLDTETLYLGGHGGKKIGTLVLAHEAMHLSNFYRRGVKMGPSYQFDTWLDEMSALMLEDLVSSKVVASYNSTRDLRYPNYLSYGSFNCALMAFRTSGCDGYSVSASYGGFLLRQLGVPFFKNLLTQNTTVSETALNNAISAYRPGSNIGFEMRKFSAAAIAALPTQGTPAGFSFAGMTGDGYTVEPIEADTLKYLRNLPTSVPTTLRPYASFPVVREAVSGTFVETVRIPAGTTLTVVIN